MVLRVVRIPRTFCFRRKVNKEHIFLNEREDLLNECRALVGKVKNPLLRMKIDSVNMVLAGHRPIVVSQMLGPSNKTIGKWVRIADERGINALLCVDATVRRKRYLSDEQMDDLRCVLYDDPRKYGYGFWTGINVSDYLFKKFGIKIEGQICTKIKAKLGLPAYKLLDLAKRLGYVPKSFRGCPTCNKMLLQQSQLDKLCCALKHPPKDFGYKMWSTKNVADFILKSFGACVTRRQCHEILLNQCYLRGVSF